MILIGLVLAAFGGRRKVIVHNVVQVSNNVNSVPADYQDQPRLRTIDADRAQARVEPPVRRTLSSHQEIDLSLEYDDDPEFTDLKSEISMTAKQALARLKAGGFDLRVRPDAVLLLREGAVVASLKSNNAIVSYADDNRY